MGVDFWGVVIGGMLTAVGSLLGHIFVMHKEAKQWLRQQEADERKRIQESESLERERLRSAYTRCLCALSLLDAIEMGDEDRKVSVTTEEMARILEEAQASLAMLLLYNPKSDDEPEVERFYKTADEFSRKPGFLASVLRRHLLKLAAHDRRLFPPGQSQN
jgi:hypothetical protein